ncbi:hypothetical protein D3C78_381540 [compost metagenome]
MQFYFFTEPLYPAIALGLVVQHHLFAVLSILKIKKGHIQCPLIDSFIHYFPIQNDPKILPNKSSALNSPVISAKAFCARRKDSATNSPA